MAAGGGGVGKFPFHPNGFINQINPSDLTVQNMIGRGAYGTVHHTLWRGSIPVAIKIFDTQNNNKDFQVEVQQLSKLSHRNIIKLIGTSVATGGKLCLVMEYAECGSLHNLLHPEAGDQLHYTFAHVVSWLQQIAYGVLYLHSNKPKAIIHRDLKPSNILLTNCGLVIKICDFGTACHPRTQMTGNKGTASWMAPEVFKAEKYNEKCDVYSFGIVIWELLARKRPFDGHPFSIMFKVVEGTRPPPIEGMPKSLDNLMQKCWEKEQTKRPTFSIIVKYFEKIKEFVAGGDIPLVGFDNKPRPDPDTIIRELQRRPLDSPPVNMPPGNILHLEPRVSPIGASPVGVSTGQLNLRPMPELHLSQSTPLFPSKSRSPEAPGSVTPHPVFPRSKSEIPPNSGGVQWSLVPQELLPLQPIPNEPTSLTMYQNYMGTLHNYIKMKENVLFLEQRKNELSKSLQEIQQKQQIDAALLSDYVKAQERKEELKVLLAQFQPKLESMKRSRNEANLVLSDL